jgi:hypothetical protein
MKAEKIFWNLPYNLRRDIYKLTNKEEYKRFNGYFNSDDLSNISWKKMKEGKFIFIHIPKTGGLSLTRALLGSEFNKHVTAKRFQLLLPEDEFKNYFKFCIVRNPWDRVVSAFLYLKKGGLTESNLIFSQRALQGINTFDDFVKNYLLKKLHEKGVYTHFIPQYKFVCDQKGQLLVDYIGRFEEYDQSCAYIFSRLGIKQPEVKKENANKERSHYREYYTPETIEIVRKIYKKDIDLFKYEF